MAQIRPLPGVRIDVAPPPASQALPRLDVAVFIGFASTGPLHLPVAVESTTQYAAVFGADAALAWDVRQGERARAHLGCAVRAFFANGGRRCWVVRVAHSTGMSAASSSFSGAAAAEANHYALPGMLAVPGVDAPVQAAIAQARCEGSWSDGLRVSCALQRRSFALHEWLQDGSPATNSHSFLTRQPLVVGDLLQIGDDDAVCAYAIIENTRATPESAGPYRVAVRLCAVFERVAASTLPLPLPGSAALDGVGPTFAATLTAATEQAGAILLRTENSLAPNLEPGHWIRFTESGNTIWLRIDESGQTADSQGNPDSPQIAAHATSSGPAWRELAVVLPPALANTLRAQKLEFELRVYGPGIDTRLRGLGLTAQRANNFWEQQCDTEFYRSRDDQSVLAPATLQRFPLAPESAPTPSAWLPLGVGPTFGASTTALPIAGTALERDGLADFGSELFIDPELAGDSVEALLAHADDIRLMRATPRPLFGMHAALGIGAGGLFNEASLLALPDAIHPGWHRRIDDLEDQGPAAPVDSGIPDPGFGSFLSCAAPDLPAPLAPRPPSQPAPADWVQSEPPQADQIMEAHWLAIHRAALRLAAASGDLFVALAMPRHFRTAQALRYTQRLRTVRQPPGDADAQALGFTEARALSYGAMYFPWLQSDVHETGMPAANAGTPRVVPPDAVATAVLALRASSRGAWIAAANEPMKDVVALTPIVPGSDWQALQDAQINLLRQDPRGFFTLSADTLSHDGELRPVNVRRLMILLRRLALRRGTSYVFEPNGPALQRAVQRGFDILLTDLFQRGAFAGATPEQSFRVVTDSTINTPQATDAGHFFVELRVAPSLPMRFLAVRLAQSGERLSVIEEL